MSGLADGGAGAAPLDEDEGEGEGNGEHGVHSERPVGEVGVADSGSGDEELAAAVRSGAMGGSDGGEAEEGEDAEDSGVEKAGPRPVDPTDSTVRPYTSSGLFSRAL